MSDVRRRTYLDLQLMWVCTESAKCSCVVIPWSRAMSQQSNKKKKKVARCSSAETQSVGRRQAWFPSVLITGHFQAA